MSTPLPKRSEIPEKYKWNLASVFATDDDWEAAIASLQNNLEQAARFKGWLITSL